MKPYNVGRKSEVTVFSGADCSGPFKSLASSEEGSQTHEKIYDDSLTKISSMFVPGGGTLVEIFDEKENKKKIDSSTKDSKIQEM